jgi:hypothetical protein
VSALEEWEDLAEQFRKETGYLRPGKDVSAAYGETDEMRDERYAAWDRWIAEKLAKAQSAQDGA